MSYYVGDFNGPQIERYEAIYAQNPREPASSPKITSDVLSKHKPVTKRKIGALWNKKASEGKEFFTGNQRFKRRNTRLPFSRMITKQMRMRLCSVFLLLLAIGSVQAENQFRFLLASSEEQLALANIATGRVSIIDVAEVEDQQSLRNPWGNVTFSPNGKYVVYLSGSEGDKELFIYEPVLEQRTQVSLPPMRRGRIRLLHILGWNEVNQVAVLDREPPIVPEKQLYGFQPNMFHGLLK